jgi:hypothetical protein
MPETVNPEIVRLTVVVSTLVEEVKHLTGKVEALKDGRVLMAEHNLVAQVERAAALNTRVEKLEGHCTWLTRTCIAEAIAFISGLVVWIIQSL